MAEIFLNKPWKEKGYCQFETINVLVDFSTSFEYLSYRSTAIINSLLIQCGDRL